MMRIGYFADGPWSHRALSCILDDGKAEIGFICARFSEPDPHLREQAETLGVPFFVEENANAPHAIAAFKAQGCDLFVSMSFDQILRSEIRQAAPFGFINCHAGALPFYRGRNVLNWALINGETEFGVTVHEVDDGIDTGDILVQRFAPIEPDDSYADLLQKAYELCAATLGEAVSSIADGRATRTPQATIHPQGFYCSQRRPGDEWIDWRWTSERLHNFVRALAPPGPGARFSVGDKIFAATRSQLIAEAPTYICIEGAIVHRGEGVTVKTGDSCVELLEVRAVQPDGSLSDATRPKWVIGTRLYSAMTRPTDD